MLRIMQLHAARINAVDPSDVAADAPMDAAGWRSYLRDRGLLEPASAGGEPEVVPLSGGVSAQVVRVGTLVCKRPYRQLKVQTDWPADIDRVGVEATALRRFAAIAPPLVHFDPVGHILIQRFVEGTDWKQLLLAGQIDPRVGTALGEALRTIHHSPVDGFTAGGRRLRQLRLDPYFAHAAAMAPEFTPVLQEVVTGLQQPGRTVVHGDFSPKNILVAPGATTVIDWEVAHLGAPEFDLAFLVCHLRAKAVHLPQYGAQLDAVEDAFFAGYRLPYDDDWYRRLLAALLIARVHGRSPLSYLTPDQNSALLEQARDLLAL